MEINYSAHSTDLFQKVIKLSQKIENLENVIRMKNSQIKHLFCEKQTLVIKVEKLQRSNHNIQQQLNMERHFYEKEKKSFQEELDYQRKKYNPSLHLRQQRELGRAFEATQEKNKRLEDELSEKNELMYHLYIKLQKLKDARDLLEKKFKLLFQNYLRALAEMMEKLDEAREEFNDIVSTQLHHLPFEEAKYLQMIQKNRELMYENAFYNFQVQKLKHHQDIVRYEMQKLKIDNESTQTVESSITSRSQRSQFQDLMTLCSSERMKKQSTGNNNKSKQSATEIEESSVFRQDQFCEECNDPVSCDITASEYDTNMSYGSSITDESSEY